MFNSQLNCEEQQTTFDEIRKHFSNLTEFPLFFIVKGPWDPQFQRGGDIFRGPLSITVTLPKNCASFSFFVQYKTHTCVLEHT